jgi:NhaP-type Na+/H+ or K+/H+ antiporter/Trk K+ transport system NAD-binding subunit
MRAPDIQNPALTIAIALVAGTLSQALADRLQVPAIIVLLALGVLLGPEVAGVVHPATLHGALLILVGFAVAVILFEGGMKLNLRRVQREDRTILRLVLGGAWVTALGAALAAHFFLGWTWPISALFGSLVIVTGPTVVTPLLRRLRVDHSTATVLEAEGVLIDAVGALIAAGTLEVVLAPSGVGFVHALMQVLLGLGLGSLFGMAAGFGMAPLLGFMPVELRNVLALSLVLVIFHLSNAVVSESGIAAVTVAGMVVGNRKPDEVRELAFFKEQLTLMLIGMLFVLLAADVQVASVLQLGSAGLWVAAALMFVVRPLNVALCSYGSSLSLRQKTFIAWIGPRGIVAAAMASLFAVRLEERQLPGGPELRALVFCVIAVTVVSAGLTGGLVAKLLGLRRATNVGWVLLGANDLARYVARALKSYGEEVVNIDTDPHFCRAAEEEGLRVLHGNGLERSTLQRAHIDTRIGALGIAQSTEVNLFFAQRTREEARLPTRAVVVGRSRASYSLDAAHKLGAEIMFGQATDIDLWNVRLRHRGAAGKVYKRTESAGKKAASLRDAPEDLCLPLVVFDGRRVFPATDASELSVGSELVLLVNGERASELAPWLESAGLRFEREFEQSASATGRLRAAS